MDSKLQQPIRDILFYRDEQGDPQAVLLEDGLAVEWIRPDTPAIPCRQDVVLGRVESISASLKAAFIAIGQSENGLLPLKDAPTGIKPGQLIVVQIRRLTGESTGTGCDRTTQSQPFLAEKGHLLTTAIQYPGWFVVVEPTTGRQIVRSKARCMPEDQRRALVEQEAAILLCQAASVAALSNSAGPVPRLLHRPGQQLALALRDWVQTDMRSIQVSDLDLFQAVDQQLADHWPALRSTLQLHGSGFTLPEIHRLGDLSSQTIRRRILLKNGGSIVLDQTEAMLVIDVNSGKAQAAQPQILRLKTNLLAAAEIARQIRLRQIAGLVVIDFIRLEREEDRNELIAALTVALARDRARITIGGLTRLGLFELIRQAR